MIGAHTASAGQVMSEADVACHFAKRGGRNRVHVFTADNAADVRTMSIDMGWSHRIKQALENDKFVLAAQPVVDTRTRKISAYEILIRMRDDDGMLSVMQSIFPGIRSRRRKSGRSSRAC